MTAPSLRAIVAAASLAAAGCRHGGAASAPRALPVSAAASAPPAVPSWRPPPGVSVELDARVELITVVQALADDAWGGPQAEDPRPRFAEFRSHPAVRRFASWSHAGTPAAAPVQALLLASSSYALVTAPESEPWVSGALGGAGAVRAFLRELKDLHERSGFDEYHRSRTAERARALEEGRAELSQGIPIDALEEYLGKPFQGRYRLVLAPRYLARGVLKAMRWTPEQTTQVQFRHTQSCPGYACFDAPYQIAQMGGSLAHELAHQMLTPPRGAARVLEASLGPSPAGCMGPASPKGWEQCLAEHVVMAVEYRLLELTGAAQRSPDALRHVNWQGLPYLRPLLDALRRYEAERARYRTLDDFYPRIVEAVRAAAREAKNPPAPAAP